MPADVAPWRSTAGPRRVAPASNTFAMAGWSISARAWRSDSKRATTCLESMPRLMSLRATRRRTGFSCSASLVDLSHAAFAELLEQTVRTDPVSRCSVTFFARGEARRLVSGVLVTHGGGPLLEPLLHQASRAQPLGSGVGAQLRSAARANAHEGAPCFCGPRSSAACASYSAASASRPTSRSISA